MIYYNKKYLNKHVERNGYNISDILQKCGAIISEGSIISSHNNIDPKEIDIT
jgi:hypothetical protein